MLFLPFLLRTNEQKIEDNAHEQKRQKSLQQIRLGSGAGGTGLLSQEKDSRGYRMHTDPLIKVLPLEQGR